jgi:hypothetical protein
MMDGWMDDRWCTDIQFGSCYASFECVYNNKAPNFFCVWAAPKCVWSMGHLQTHLGWANWVVADKKEASNTFVLSRVQIRTHFQFNTSPIFSGECFSNFIMNCDLI